MSDKANELKNKGNSAFQSGDYDIAVDFFTQAIAIDPSNYVLYSNRSAAYSQLSKYQEALEDANKCIELNNRFVKGYTRKGAALHGLKRFEEARDVYSEGLEIEPDNAACKEGLSSLPPEDFGMPAEDPSLGMGNIFKNAKELCQTHPKLKEFAKDPEFMRKVEQLQTNPTANLSTALMDPRLQTLLSVMLQLPEDTFSKAHSASSPYGAPPSASHTSSSSSTPSASTTAPPKVAAPAPNTPAGQAQQAKDEGNKAYQKKNFTTALVCYERAIQLDPTQIGFYLNKAACLLEMANALEKDAETEKAEGKKAEPLVMKTKEQLGEKPKEKKMKKVQRRVKKIKKVKRPVSVGVEKKAEDGCIAADDDEEVAPIEEKKTEEEEEVEVEYEEIVEVEVEDTDDTTTPHTFQSLLPPQPPETALAMERREWLLAAAMEACEQGLFVGKEMGGASKVSFEQIAKTYLRMANVEIKRVRYKEAMELLEKSLLEHRLDEAVRKQKELQELIKKKEEMDYLDETKGEEARLKGNDAFARGAFPEAIEFYNDSVRRNPKDARIYSNRAACHAKLMNWTPALEDCEKAIALDPKFIKPYIRKGNIQMFLKQYPQALKTFEEAMALDPQNQDVQQGYQQLIARIQSSQGEGKADEQQIYEAMKDPEIRSIMQDPVMQNILNDMQNNPARAQMHLQNPKVASALAKLMAAGIIKTK